MRIPKTTLPATIPSCIPLLLALTAFGCSGATVPVDAGVDSALLPLTPAQSKIEHLIVIVQENHTFDSYFAHYCTAATGSAPTCTTGPACCETAPTSAPGTTMPATVLDDAEEAGFDPDHSAQCETMEIDGGKMDGYITSTFCGSKQNVAYAPASSIQPYWDLASQGALADHYFQSMVGQSSGNDMYLVRAQYVFTDNAFEPHAIGSQCSVNSAHTTSYQDQTIADLLIARGATYAWYIEGYQAAVSAVASHGCPMADDACPIGINIWPCTYESGDIPIAYYPTTRDNPLYMRDLTQLASDLTTGRLPQVVFIKHLGFRQEHPGYKSNLRDGINAVEGDIALLAASQFAESTLLLLTYDEGGGFYDHMSPPPASTVDNQPYGTRTPLIAVGPFALKNAISHTQMEHSSIVRFIEWNWLDGATGQLKGRDAVVNNLGSLLDPTVTGIAVPN